LKWEGGPLFKKVGREWGENLINGLKGGRVKVKKLIISMARLKGFEPPTYGLEVRCSIHLSYRRKIFP
jgi:hypothetical protein